MLALKHFSTAWYIDDYSFINFSNFTNRSYHFFQIIVYAFIYSFIYLRQVLKFILTN